MMSKYGLRTEFIYEKRYGSDIPEWLLYITVPDEAIYIRPRRVKNKREYEVFIIYHRYDPPKPKKTIAVFSKKIQALEYCYEQYLMDKLSGMYVHWHGPEPEKFIKGK